MVEVYYGLDGWVVAMVTAIFGIVGLYRSIRQYGVIEVALKQQTGVINELREKNGQLEGRVKTLEKLISKTIEDVVAAEDDRKYAWSQYSRVASGLEMAQVKIKALEKELGR